MSGYWPPVIIGPCRVCGWKALTEGGLCTDCREFQEWSRVNRLFCALVHGGILPERTAEEIAASRWLYAS